MGKRKVACLTILFYSFPPHPFLKGRWERIEFAQQERKEDQGFANSKKKLENLALIELVSWEPYKHSTLVVVNII